MPTHLQTSRRQEHRGTPNGRPAPKLPTRWPLALSTAAVSFASVASFGQEPSAPQDVSGLFSEVIEVRVINVEVVVTDRAGDRVSGLRPEDFELIVDGREIPIEYFSEIAGGAAQEALAGQRSQPGALPGELVPRNFLLFVDDNHTIKRERDLVVRGLIDDLDFLGSSDRLAIVVQSGTRLHMLSSWSNDRRVLGKALSRLLDAREFGGSFRSPLWTARQQALQRTNTFADVRSDFSGDTSFRSDSGFGPPATGRLISGASFVGNADLPSSSQDGDFELRELLIDLEFAVTGAVSTMRGFAMPQGRKAMLLLGGDWPIGPFESEGGTLTPLSGGQVIAPLIETANLLGYTLYPVGLNGARSIWRNASNARVADRTGGQTLYERTAVLADIIQDTENYYWLGFAPTMAGNNSGHDIEVRVKSSGLSARARDSYLDLSRSAQLAMMTQGALLFGSPDEDSDLTIEFGQATKWGLRKMNVPVTVDIPLAKLTSVSIQGEDVIEMELRFIAVDENGASSQVPAIPITLRGNHEAGEVYRFETSFHLRRRPHQILVSVYDSIAGKTINAKTEVSYRSTQENDG